MAKETDATFQAVFSQVSSTDSIKLLPWYISPVVPLCYMNEALATSVQQDEDISVTTTVPKLEDSQAPDPSDSPACQTGTPLLWMHPLLDIPFNGTPPQLGAHLLDSLPAPHRESGTTLQAVPSMTNVISRPMLTPRRLRSRANTALHRVMKTHPNWYWRLGPALNHKGRNLPVPLPVQPRPLLILTMVLWWEPWGVLGIRTVRTMPTTLGPHPTWTCPERMWLTLMWSQPLGTVSHVQTQMT